MGILNNKLSTRARDDWRVVMTAVPAAKARAQDRRMAVEAAGRALAAQIMAKAKVEPTMNRIIKNKSRAASSSPVAAQELAHALEKTNSTRKDGYETQLQQQQPSKKKRQETKALKSQARTPEIPITPPLSSSAALAGPSRKATSRAKAKGKAPEKPLELSAGAGSKGRVTRGMARILTDNGQLSPSAPYLSYHDVLLTGEDVRCLKNDWLTDNNITFWEEFLEREILPKYPMARVVLLRPSMTLLLIQSTEVGSMASALPSFSKVTHIFLPVNDCHDTTRADTGSHWSLLLVSVLDGVAFHYDSLGGLNYYEAQKCTDRLGKVLGMPLRFHQLDDAPQQVNSIDCGVFVCVMMRHLLVKRLLNANADEKVSMSMAGKVIDSNGGRKEMLKIIESLRKEGERRRSASPLNGGGGSKGTPPRIE